MRDGTSLQPSYWAVLPAEIRYDDRIPASAKLLYAEISSLTGRGGYCWAENDYFARLYKINERTVRRLLDALAEFGYIRIEEERSRHKVLDSRRIYAGINPLAGSSESLDKKVQRPESLDKNVRSLDKKVQRHFIKKDQEIIPIGDRVAKTLETLPQEVAEAMLRSVGDNTALLDAWTAFAEMRRVNRKPIKTLRTFELLEKSLRKAAGDDSSRAIAVLEQSTGNSWTGLFPLDEDRLPPRRMPAAAPQRGGDVEWL